MPIQETSYIVLFFNNLPTNNLSSAPRGAVKKVYGLSAQDGEEWPGMRSERMGKLS